MKHLNHMMNSMLLAGMLFSGIAVANASDRPRTITVDHALLERLPLADQQRVLQIADRLQVIASLDRTELDRSEKRALNAEVNTLRAEAKDYNQAAGGTVIYISTAGIIIILLLLIIIL